MDIPGLSEYIQSIDSAYKSWKHFLEGQDIPPPDEAPHLLCPYASRYPILLSRSCWQIFGGPKNGGTLQDHCREVHGKGVLDVPDEEAKWLANMKPRCLYDIEVIWGFMYRALFGEIASKWDFAFVPDELRFLVHHLLTFLELERAEIFEIWPGELSSTDTYELFQIWVMHKLSAMASAAVTNDPLFSHWSRFEGSIDLSDRLLSPYRVQSPRPEEKWTPPGIRTPLQLPLDLRGSSDINEILAEEQAKMNQIPYDKKLLKRYQEEPAPACYPRNPGKADIGDPRLPLFPPFPDPAEFERQRKKANEEDLYVPDRKVPPPDRPSRAPIFPPVGKEIHGPHPWYDEPPRSDTAKSPQVSCKALEDYQISDPEDSAETWSIERRKCPEATRIRLAGFHFM